MAASDKMSFVDLLKIKLLLFSDAMSGASDTMSGFDPAMEELHMPSRLEKLENLHGRKDIFKIYERDELAS